MARATVLVVVDEATLSRIVRRAVRRALTPIKEQLMTDQADVLAQLDELKTLATETRKDVLRVAQALDDAVKAGDLGAVAASVAELRTIVQGTDDAAEAASPEPVDQPPTDGGSDLPPVDPNEPAGQPAPTDPPTDGQ